MKQSFFTIREATRDFIKALVYDKVLNSSFSMYNMIWKLAHNCQVLYAIQPHGFMEWGVMNATCCYGIHCMCGKKKFLKMNYIIFYFINGTWNDSTQVHTLSEIITSKSQDYSILAWRSVLESNTYTMIAANILFTRFPRAHYPLLYPILWSTILWQPLVKKKKDECPK